MHRLKNAMTLPAIFCVLSMSTPSLKAEETHTINQKDHMFSEIFIKVKNDDVVKFVNLDSVKHRLIFTHKGQREEMNAVEPGKSQEVKFSHAGIYDVQCKIHPEMKLTIFVPPAANLTRLTDSFYTF